MMTLKKWLPNILTLGNLLCGILASISIISFNNWDFAILLIVIALILDFGDGFLARILKVSGEMGKQLDSLADMVSFGVVPGLLVFSYLNDPGFLYTQGSGVLTFPFQQDVSNGNGLTLGVTYISLVALLIPLFSAIRLAKFNIDTRQTDSFLGVPTPACAIFWLTIFQSGFGHINEFVVITMILVSCLLLVSEIPLFSLKFKNFTWSDNSIRFIFLGLCIAVLILSVFILNNIYSAFPIIIILYLLLSGANNLLKKSHAV